MIDLYALPTDFPGWEEAEKSRIDPYARVAHLEQALARASYALIVLVGDKLGA